MLFFLLVLNKRAAEFLIIYENGVISENGMKMRWKKWFYSNAYIVTRKRALLTHYLRFSCELFWCCYIIQWLLIFKVKANCFCLFWKVVIVVKIAKKSKLFRVCCHGNQFYATHITCLQFNFERYFKYLQHAYSLILKGISNIYNVILFNYS